MFALWLLAPLFLAGLVGCKGSARFSESLDQNGDGKIDTWNFYQNGILERIEKDTNGDEKPDLWEYFSDAKAVRRDFDRNGDGKVDHQIFLRSGRELFDNDFDGTFEQEIFW